MTSIWKYTAVAIGFVSLVGAAEAQSLRSNDGPAETPPASYSANQYVDSKGCVYIRAGFGGNTTWVPRVNRSRNVICGFQPTFAGARPPATTPPPPTTTVATLPPPTTPPATTPPPARTVTTTPPPRTPTVPPPTVRVQTAPPPAVVRPPAGGGRTVCPGLSPLAQKYVTGGGYAVRCGPQGNSPYVSGDASGLIHVQQPPAITPPPGYKAAWEDDRLNPNRGHVTPEGFVQMRLVWTAGVPRKLVTPGNERFPVVNAVPNDDREFVVSTKGTEPPSAMPAGHRFVQVGTFSTEANARAAAAGIQSRGLPVRISNVRQKGKTYSIVLAGPFASARALQSGLNTVRGVGYRDAFTRK